VVRGAGLDAGELGEVNHLEDPVTRSDIHIFREVMLQGGYTPMATGFYRTLQGALINSPDRTISVRDHSIQHLLGAEEKRLHSHGQEYDLVERPLIRWDEEMVIEKNMVLAVHPMSATPTSVYLDL
jgi:hypothetical protein